MTVYFQVSAMHITCLVRVLFPWRSRQVEKPKKNLYLPYKEHPQQIFVKQRLKQLCQAALLRLIYTSISCLVLKSYSTVILHCLKQIIIHSTL